MRLWHQKLLPYLPRQQLLGQHRECCALRGAGWGRRHSVVNYVFAHEPERLAAYHFLVMDEMARRGYHPDRIWTKPNWRGNKLQEQEGWCSVEKVAELILSGMSNEMIYEEHNDEYLKECLDNLASKNIIIEMED